MFREMRRFKQQLTHEECIELLKVCGRAALSINGEDGYPYTIPVNFVYDEDNGLIYFHSAREGSKADLLAKDDKVCFTIWGGDFKKEGHWEWNVKSVVIFGRCRRVTDGESIINHLRALALKYYPTPEEAEAELAPNGPVSRVNVYAIETDHMTGKLVNEK